jgi:hypothetical protein
MYSSYSNVSSWASLFFTYINDLPPTLSTLLKPIIFTDDTSVLISSKKFDDFNTGSNIVFSQMSKWFSVNKLLILDKTNIIKFIMNNSSQHTSGIGYNEICRRVSKEKGPWSTN